MDFIAFALKPQTSKRNEGSSVACVVRSYFNSFPGCSQYGLLY